MNTVVEAHTVLTAIDGHFQLGLADGYAGKPPWEPATWEKKGRWHSQEAYKQGYYIGQDIWKDENTKRQS